MNKSIKKLFLTIIMFVVFFTPIKANAENESFNLNLVSNSSKISTGNEVTVTIGISDINAGENGIGALKLKLDYDDSKFEKITQNDISSKNNWTDITYNEDSKILILLQDNLPYTKTEEEVCTIKLKAKDIKENEKVNFSVNEVEGSNSESTVTSSDVTLELNSSNTIGNNVIIMYACIAAVLAIITIIVIILLCKKKRKQKETNNAEK